LPFYFFIRYIFSVYFVVVVVGFVAATRRRALCCCPYVLLCCARNPFSTVPLFPINKQTNRRPIVYSIYIYIYIYYSPYILCILYTHSSILSTLQLRDGCPTLVLHFVCIFTLSFVALDKQQQKKECIKFVCKVGILLKGGFIIPCSQYND